jgi:hypothetical protein
VAPLWFTFSSTIANAVVEEVVMLGIFFRLLEYIPLRGRPLAFSVWGTLLLAAMRTEYHLYQGIALIWAVLPFALLITQYYSGYRALLPVIAGHALYDQWITFKLASSGLVYGALFAGFAWVCFWVWCEGPTIQRSETRELRRELTRRKRETRSIAD